AADFSSRSLAYRTRSWDGAAIDQPRDLRRARLTAPATLRRMALRCSRKVGKMCGCRGIDPVDAPLFLNRSFVPYSIQRHLKFANTPVAFGSLVRRRPTSSAPGLSATRPPRMLAR